LIDERAIGVHSVDNEASEQVGNEVTVAARDSVELIEFKKDAVRLVDFGTFGECLGALHRQLEFLGEWFHRLHTSDVGTRNDPAYNEIPNNLSKRVGLSLASF
jgi:hypothetical protein